MLFFLKLLDSAVFLLKDLDRTQALIKHLGKPELLQLCRLVQRVGENGAFSGFKVRGDNTMVGMVDKVTEVIQKYHGDH